jgi:protocatechuate 3,4-dioxygenase, beta subunit
MKPLYLLPLLLLACLCGCSQTASQSKTRTHVGGQCEGCEAIHESPVPFDSLGNLCWLPDWKEPGKKIAINGTVYKADGKTPAPGVIIYLYHTDQKGVYPTKGNEKGWAKRHGYLRGWMKTDENGSYKFFTLWPAPYPGGSIPAHIHVTIKEPGMNEYWIDEFLFEGDPFLTDKERQSQTQRGGSGIVKMKDVGQMFKSERNIYLGKNIPDYPKPGF